MKNNNIEEMTEDRFQVVVEMLRELVENPGELYKMTEERRIELFTLAGRLSHPDKKELRERKKAKVKVERETRVEADRKARALSGIRSAREAKVFVAPTALLEETIISKAENVLSSPRNCYVCKEEYTTLHHFYDCMCKKCGDFNYAKRFVVAPMDGQVVLMTGSRLKIGYQATMLLLRSGATVIATTRFPVDSALRYSAEPDYDTWKDRLHIYGLDLRHIPSVEIFATYVEQNYDRLDVIINNAAQTVRRPSGFYTHMMENETKSMEDIPEKARHLLKSHYKCITQLQGFDHLTAEQAKNLPVAWHGNQTGIGIRASAQLSQIPYSFDNSIVAEEVFPQGKLDADLQQVDLRTTNSWRLRLGEVPTVEVIEVQLVNSVAPFVLINRLIGLMRKDFTGKKHIVNVSAIEGKFFRFRKEDRHPHTNMAKAALNMMTHTSASDFAKDGIYMNAVDTGWVTDEDPAQLSQYKEEVHDFQPPLDIVDGAARILDPLFDGILTGKHWCGQFLKDYFPIDW